VFPAPEWIRFDLIQPNRLRTHVRESVDAWRAIPSNRGDSLFRQEQLRVSRQTYEKLEALLTEHKTLSVRGGTRSCLQAIPEYARYALTPLDPLFLASELGQKIKQDLDKVGAVEVFKLDTESRRLQFLNADGREIYRIQVSDVSSNEAQKRIIGQSFVRGSRAELNALIRPSLLNGSFWNPRQMDRNPLGVYVSPQERWVDESGVTHFHGDGHDHKH
jgi:hypothetical protein